MWNSLIVGSYELLLYFNKNLFYTLVECLMNKRESQTVCPIYTLLDKSVMKLIKTIYKSNDMGNNLII